jgi:6-phosphogluconolactonase
VTEREVVILEDAAAVAREAAGRVVALAADAVTRRGRFALALSGGSTPRALHTLLTLEPLRSRVAWERLEVFWGDERCVPPTHSDSNYRMARETLLDAVPVPAARIHPIAAGTGDPGAVAVAYEAEIARVLGGTPGGPPPAFDLVLLGMGADGHTASLFPDTAALAERRRWVVANHVPKLGVDRITLTWPILNRAAHVLFLVAGGDKAAVLREVLEEPADIARLPSQGIRLEAGRLVWLVDRAAAAQLTSTPNPREG